MPQQSYLYVSSQVSMLGIKLIGKEKFLRMMESSSLKEAVKQLFEGGFAEGASISDPNEFEVLLKQELENVLTFVKKGTPESASTDGFLLKYDYQNAKMAMKCKYTRQPLHSLFGCGLVETKAIEGILQDDYSLLPKKMAEACGKIDKEFFAGNRKPTTIDVLLDKAYFAHVKELIKKSKSSGVKSYFTDLIDGTNVLSFFRVKQGNLPQEYLDQLLIEGGNLPLQLLKDGDDIVEKLDQFKPLGKLCQSLIDQGLAVSSAEAFLKNQIKTKLMENKHNIEGIEPLVVYFLEKEAEIYNIRLILVCVKNGVPKEQIKERLSDMYV